MLSKCVDYTGRLKLTSSNTKHMYVNPKIPGTQALIAGAQYQISHLKMFGNMSPVPNVVNQHTQKVMDAILIDNTNTTPIFMSNEATHSLVNAIAQEIINRIPIQDRKTLP
uniref:Uncharacterized protein n=1 Tax=Lactuca sativa TaxID=4236 RepID=A0A9R1VXH5_LACSA|nr:hypothetical protein LSAT_V11C400217950 [Lactuca sativa]